MPSPEPEQKTKYDVGWRRIVRNFTPSWFSATMGTGICGVLLHAIPWQASWMHALSVAYFVLNTLLFFSFLGISLLRYVLWPEIWRVMMHDPTHSLFLGTVPMGFATLLQMWTLLCVPLWGPWASTLVWALWIVDVVVAVAIAISLPFLLMSRHPINSLDRIVALQLLPVISTVVAAGTGARIAGVLPDPQRALATLVVSYILLGMGLPLALLILTVYYLRLCLHKLPPREVVASCFLPLGPVGFGGFAAMQLGKDALALWSRTGTLTPVSAAGEIAYVFGFLVALVLWGFGMIWLGLALFTIHEARPFPFNIGWWGFTFPLGVFAASTLQIGQEMPSAFFDVLGTVFAVSVIMLWVLVSVNTVKGALNGKLFHAPCLSQLPEKYRYPQGEEEEIGDKVA